MKKASEIMMEECLRVIPNPKTCNKCGRPMYHARCQNCLEKIIMGKEKMNKADRLFARYIVRKNSMNGLVRCYTCDKCIPIQYAQCSHFRSRGHFGTRYDERNCKPACNTCNVVKGGNLKVFERRLIAEYGQEIVDDLHRLSNAYCAPDYDFIIETYRRKLAELKRQ